ncbi:MAG: 6-phosphofructokinase [Clostridiales bacterium]|nr:6-phosphofructokinase [Candidatus Equinaster intestinalis]
MEIKTIGVLTSGGDAPGMNAAVRSVVRSAVAAGLNVKGIRRGYNGLIENDVVDLNVRSVSDIIHRGGTVLYTARSPLFKTEEGVDLAVESCKKLGIDGIVVIGGDGSFRGARDLSLKGIPCVGIPGTIDNDISSTEYTIGFDTAMNTAMEMVDKLRDTAQSHERCSVVEVMGRHAGWLALQTGIAVGATAILVPEVDFNLKRDVIDKIEQAKKTGKMHFIIIVAEGIGKVYDMAEEIEAATGIETRATVLGHVQRGGSPTVRDRVMASEMGNAAVALLKKGIGNRVVAYKENKIVDYDIYEALAMKKPFDFEAYKIANEISI